MKGGETSCRALEQRSREPKSKAKVIATSGKKRGTTSKLGNWVLGSVGGAQRWKATNLPPSVPFPPPDILCLSFFLSTPPLLHLPPPLPPFPHLIIQPPLASTPISSTAMSDLHQATFTWGPGPSTVSTHASSSPTPTSTRKKKTSSGGGRTPIALSVAESDLGPIGTNPCRALLPPKNKTPFLFNLCDMRADMINSLSLSNTHTMHCRPPLLLIISSLI